MNNHILRVLLLSSVFSLVTMWPSPSKESGKGIVTMPEKCTRKPKPQSHESRALTGRFAGIMFLLDANEATLPVANISLQGITAKMNIAGMTY